MKLTAQDITIGSDPEYCLFDSHKKRISSALNYLPNGKEKKVDLGDGYRFFSDNVLGEGEIPPADSGEKLVKNFTQLVKRATEALADKGIRLMAKASHEFLPEDLDNEIALTMGCSVSMDANIIAILEPKNLRETSLRTAGGHCHVGRKDYKTCKSNDFMIEDWSKIAGIRAMDRLLGTTMTYLENDPSAPARKALYGKSGEHRCCVYGYEYRVLSNYFVSRPELIFFGDSLARYAVLECQNDPAKYLGEYDFSEVKRIIDTGCQKSALDFIQKELPAHFVKEAKALKKLKFSPWVDENFKI